MTPSVHIQARLAHASQRACRARALPPCVRDRRHRKSAAWQRAAGLAGRGRLGPECLARGPGGRWSRRLRTAGVQAPFRAQRDGRCRWRPAPARLRVSMSARGGLGEAGRPRPAPAGSEVTRPQSPQAGQVLGHRGLRQPQRGGQVRDPGRPDGKAAHDHQPRRVAQGPETRPRPAPAPPRSIAAAGDVIAIWRCYHRLTVRSAGNVDKPASSSCVGSAAVILRVCLAAWQAGPAACRC